MDQPLNPTHRPIESTPFRTVSDDQTISTSRHYHAASPTKPPTTERITKQTTTLRDNTTTSTSLNPIESHSKAYATASPEQSGVTEKHLKAIQSLCAQHNVSLFLRPSTPATMRLIDLGFATKSTDIHHKSSDWGLMAGFVPCDPYFSKAHVGQADLNIASNTHSHGASHPTHLSLSTDQLNELKAAHHFGELSSVSHSDMKNSDKKLNYYSHRSDASKVFIHNPENGNIFWQASKRDADGTTKVSGKQVPMLVWGYEQTKNEPSNTTITDEHQKHLPTSDSAMNTILPITGDYDSWMICFPKREHQEPVHCYIDQHGATAATQSEIDFIQAANDVCGQEVFRHGSEARNTEFAQGLDSELVYFSATDEPPRMIKGDQVHSTLEAISHSHEVDINQQWLPTDRDTMNYSRGIKASGPLATGANFARLKSYLDNEKIPTDALPPKDRKVIKSILQQSFELKHFTQYEKNWAKALKPKFMKWYGRIKKAPASNGLQQNAPSETNTSFNRRESLMVRSSLRESRHSFTKQFESIRRVSSSLSSDSTGSNSSSIPDMRSSIVSLNSDYSFSTGSSSEFERRGSSDLENTGSFTIDENKPSEDLNPQVTKGLDPHSIFCRGIVFDRELNSLYPLVTSEQGEVRRRDHEKVGNDNQDRYRLISFEGNRFIHSLAERSLVINND